MVYDKFKIEPLILCENDITLLPEEPIHLPYGTYDVITLAYGDVLRYGKPALRFTFVLPYKGDKELFLCSPKRLYVGEGADKHDPTAPHGKVIETANELWIRTVAEHDTKPDFVQAAFEENLQKIRHRVNELTPEVEYRNKELKMFIHSMVNDRFERIQKGQQILSNLGYPVRRRTDATARMVTAEEPRERIATQPVAPVDHVTEPVQSLELSDYDQILNTISRLALILERNPTTFSKFGEVDLRNEILVILNTHFEGKNATGETFNSFGKCDILIQDSDNRNLFVAECKIWVGPSDFIGALNQLLGYVTWRDTKAALIIFNKGRDHSTVLSTIRDNLKAHPSFVRSEPYDEDLGARAVIKHPSDSGREILLTVLAFYIQPEKP